MKRVIAWTLAGLLLSPTGDGAGFGENRFDCLLEPNVAVDLGGGSPGVVSKVTVQRGQRIRKGQVLVRLNDGLERTALKRANTQIARGKRRLERNQALYEMKMLTPEERDDIVMEIRAAEADAAAARERVRQRVLKSPIDGVVVERSIDPGELLGTDPVLRLASLDPLHVEVILPAAYYGQVSVGQWATVFPAEPVGGGYRARVVIVDPMIDSGSGTFRVRLSLKNPENRIPAGLRCEVRFGKSSSTD